MTRSAFLTMDVQSGLADTIGSAALLDRLGDALAVARAREMLVVPVKVGLRPGYPDVAASNRAFSGIAAANRFVEGVSSTYHPVVEPNSGEIAITKRRINAFFGTDLDVVLRSNGVTDLVLTGISTSGVVLSTLRAAIDLDYRVTVLRDCCADPDAVVHATLMDRVFPAHASVLACNDWITAQPTATS